MAKAKIKLRTGLAAPRSALSTIERLIVIRHRKGWTQGDIAKRIGLTVRTLRSYEGGRSKPHPLIEEAMRRFADDNM